MSRIEPLAIADWPPKMRAALAALMPPDPRHARPVSEDRPQGRNILGLFAHHPALARAFMTFNGHVLMATTLSERHREMLIMRVVAVRKSKYEWVLHRFVALDTGFVDEELARIALGPDGPFWSQLDAALLQAADELISEGAISAGTWATLSGHMTTQQLLDVIFTVGCYDTLSRMCDSLELDLDDDVRASTLQTRHRI